MDSWLDSLWLTIRFLLVNYVCLMTLFFAPCYVVLLILIIRLFFITSFFLLKTIFFFAEYGSWTQTKTNKAFLYKLTCGMMTIRNGALARG
jgi:hypothetical protein